MPDTTTTESPPRAGGLLMLLGGAAVLATAFVDWGRPEVDDRRGFDLAIRVRGGALALILGGVLIGLGLLLVLVRSRGLRVALGVITIVLGVAATAFFSALFVAGDTGYRVAWANGCVNARECTRISGDALKKQLDRAIEQHKVDFTPHRQTGVYVALAGGVVALIGGILGLRRGRRVGPPGGAGWPTAAQGVQPAAPPLSTPPPTTGAPPQQPAPEEPPAQQRPTDQPPPGGGGSFTP